MSTCTPGCPSAWPTGLGPPRLLQSSGLAVEAPVEARVPGPWVTTGAWPQDLFFIVLKIIRSLKGLLFCGDNLYLSL